MYVLHIPGVESLKSLRKPRLLECDDFTQMLESTRIKSSKKLPFFKDNTYPVPIHAGFDNVLMN